MQRVKRHRCHLCRKLRPAAWLFRVSVNPYDDLTARYAMWTPSRAAYFRAHRWKRPQVAWLCVVCIDEHRKEGAFSF